MAKEPDKILEIYIIPPYPHIYKQIWHNNAV